VTQQLGFMGQRILGRTLVSANFPYSAPDC